MVIKAEQELSCKDIEVLVRYAKMNKDVESILNVLQSMDTRIKCSLEGEIKWIQASEIYYIESIDKKTFVYCEQKVYRTEFRLYQLVDDLLVSGFVQISKSCIVNIHVLDSIKPLINSRMEALLINGERLYVTRKYLTNIKKALLDEEDKEL